MKESDIQRDCESFLKLHNFFYWRNHTSGVRFKGKGMAKSRNKGSPDIMAIKDGKFYGIEIKKPNGVLSKDQIEWLERATNHGAISIVARSVEEMADLLNLKIESDDQLLPLVFD